MFFIFVSFFRFLLGREFKLRDPVTQLYFGVDDKNFMKLVPLSESLSFRDERSESEHGAVNVYVTNQPNYVWDYDRGNKKMIIYPFHGGDNQTFDTVFLGKEVVNIGVQEQGDKCMTVERNTRQFYFSECDINNNWKNQRFYITDIHGIWAGSANTSYTIDSDGRVVPESCPKCVLGGFASESNGYYGGYVYYGGYNSYSGYSIFGNFGKLFARTPIFGFYW